MALILPNAQDCGLDIQDISGKGKGVVAIRSFSRGENVFSEHPLLTQNLARNNTTVLSALAECTAVQREQFYSLYNCHADTLPAELGIFETNVLPCGGNDAHGHVAKLGGVFLFGSRFNSSCKPNVNNRWEGGTREVVFRAVRDIEAGEELCIGYGSLLAKRDERREELWRKFKFECRCEACMLQDQDLADSDTRRECLQILFREHSKRLRGDPMEGIGEAMVALRLLREEGLPVYESSFYFTGFHFCAAVSDYASAKTWACKGQDAACAIFGEESARAWKQYSYNPQLYSAAGTMSRRTLTGPDSLAWSFLGF